MWEKDMVNIMITLISVFQRRPIIKKKASREGRLEGRHAVFGGDAFNNIDALTPEYGGTFIFTCFFYDTCLCWEIILEQ